MVVGLVETAGRKRWTFFPFDRNSDSVLSDKDCENVYELVYSSHRQVAQAAGEFLNTKLFQRDDEATKHLKTAKGKKRSPNTPLIRDLVQFFIESEVREPFCTFVFIYFYFLIHFIIPFGKFRPPYLCKATATARAALPSPTSACRVFSCFCNPSNSDMDYRDL